MMTNSLVKALEKAESLPEHIQEELAKQLIEDIESEIQWQQTLSQPQSSILEELAAKALDDSQQGKTRVMGFDEL